MRASLTSDGDFYKGGIRPNGDGTRECFNTACASFMGLQIPNIPLVPLAMYDGSKLTRYGADTSKFTAVIHDGSVAFNLTVDG